MANKKSRIIDLFLLALITAVLVKIFLFQTFKVESESMMPFLHPGDQILCLGSLFFTRIVRDEKTGKKHKTKIIRRGDILVFKPPVISDEEYVKRAVCLEKESVEIVSNKVRIDGVALNEPYAVFEQEVVFYRDLDRTYVPEGYVFVMGDNRDHSSDSRSWGAVALDRVEGKMVMVFWPLKHFKFVSGRR